MSLASLKNRLHKIAESQDWLKTLQSQGRCLDCGVIISKKSKRCIMHSTIRRFYPKTLALALVLLSVAFIPTGPTLITLAWNAQPSVDVFKIYSSTDITSPLTNWTLLANVPGVTNSWPVTILPGKQFFYLTASNFWGETGPSNVTNTPSVPLNITNLQISR